MTQTVRQNRPLATLCVDPMLVQLAFPEACGRDVDTSEMQMGIRRAGGCEHGYVVGYNAFGRDDMNRVAFRLDAKLHDLEAGYYDAVLLADCVPCGTIRLDMTKKPPLAMGSPTATNYTECPPAGEALPGTGHTDMFDQYLGWSAKLTCRLDRTATTIKVGTGLPAPTGAAPQLVIRDGVASEVVDVVSHTSGAITVVRGNPARQFPVGACVQFEWTEANIKAVANEDCPVVDPGTDTGTDTDTKECTVLEAGKGIVLDTSEDGKIIVKLSPTSVVPGTYGGLAVDECGRVSTVDANFPAAGIPVFDNCCKSDDEDAPEAVAP